MYNWSHIDDIMSAAAARNMGVLAEVNATPLWAGPNPNAPGFPIGADTPNVEKFTEFMQDFVVRYGETVSAYEIWNEPNYSQFSNPIDPEAYAALLAAVYPVIKELDATATVVAGAVGATQNSPFTMDPVQFVQRMLAAGAGDFFDALSVHPYGEEIKYSESCPTCEPTMLTPREQVEAIMGMLEGKKVWITEYGLPTTPGGPWTEADQAAFIKDLLDHWQTYGEDVVGPIFLYTGRDTPNPANPTNVHDYYGLWTEDGTLKPAGQMLKDWLEAYQPQEPGEPGEPGGPGQVLNPIAQFLSAVVQAIAQAIANFFAQFAPPPPPTVALVAQTEEAPEMLSRTAGLESVEDGVTVADTSVTAVEGDVVSDTTGAEIISAEITEPVVVEPVVVEPVVVEPVVTEPVVVEPVVVEPVVTEPVVTEPVVTEPVVVEPVVTEPVVTEPESSTKPSTDAEPGDTDSAAEADKTAQAEGTKAKPDPSSDSSTSSNARNGQSNGPAGGAGSTVKAKAGSSTASSASSASAASDSDSPSKSEE
jgi:hypothetical protein